jgi:hypothetical protein
MFSRALVMPVIALTACCLAGCATADAHEQSTAGVVVPMAHTEPTTPTSVLPRQLPGLGPRTLAQVPANADQVVLVAGTGTGITRGRGGSRSAAQDSRGSPLAGSFDYVVAVNFNREPGTDPLNRTRPLGPAKGGGVWLHVDHGGPTHGCVSLPKADMVTLLQTLDPAENPVVVRGDPVSLAR